MDRKSLLYLPLQLWQLPNSLRRAQQHWNLLLGAPDPVLLDPEI
jgi:hypothetical protein